MPEGAVDRLTDDGWLTPDDAAEMESRVELLRHAVQDALAKMHGGDLIGAELALASALNSLDASGEVR